MVKTNLIPCILKSKDWSIYRLAQELEGKLSRNQVYKLANDPVVSGKTEFDTLALLAAALNVKITELYEETSGATTEWKNKAGEWVTGVVIEDQGQNYRLIDPKSGETITVPRNRVRVPKTEREVSNGS